MEYQWMIIIMKYVKIISNHISINRRKSIPYNEEVDR